MGGGGGGGGADLSKRRKLILARQPCDKVFTFLSPLIYAGKLRWQLHGTFISSLARRDVHVFVDKIVFL